MKSWENIMENKELVCAEWHDFENFSKWFDENFYQFENEPMRLSRKWKKSNDDLYSPESCIFIPAIIDDLLSIVEKPSNDECFKSSAKRWQIKQKALELLKRNEILNDLPTHIAEIIKEYNLNHLIKVKLSGVKPLAVEDGPGIRLSIYTQFCSFSCKGCHNPETQSRQGGYEVTVAELIEMIDKSEHISGVTFSGGDPLEQSFALSIVANYAKSKGLNVWAYTGHTYENVVNDEFYSLLIKELDVLVDGPFIMKQKNLKLKFRGSENQRLINVAESTGGIVKCITY